MRMTPCGGALLALVSIVGAPAVAVAGGPTYDEYRALVAQVPAGDAQSLVAATRSWETARLRGLAALLAHDAPRLVGPAAVLHLFAARQEYADKRDRRAADHIEAGLRCLGLDRKQVTDPGRAGGADAGPLASLGVSLTSSLRKRLPPTTRQWLLALAYWYQSLLLPRPAESVYEALLAADPTDADALLGAGTVDELLAFPSNLVVGPGDGATDASLRAALARSAEQRFRAALRVQPTLATARAHLGRLLVEREDLQAATAELTSALATDDAHAGFLAHLLLGRVRETEGRLAGAIDDYRAAVALAPDSQAGHLALSYALQAAGQTSASTEELLDMFGDPADGSPDAWADYQMGLARRLPQAMEILRQEVQP